MTCFSNVSATSSVTLAIQNEGRLNSHIATPPLVCGMEADDSGPGSTSAEEQDEWPAAED